MEKLRILVTGGAGYIGSHIVRDLCEDGHDVTVLDNLSLGFEENVDRRAGLVVGDILSNDDLDKVLSKKIDVVFHFAAWKAAGESMIDPAKYSENNITGALRLLQAMVRHKAKFIVFSSSCAVYGSPEYLPMDEKHPRNPENYYGYTKLSIEENLQWYSRLKDIRYSALRYFNATGYDVKGQIKGKEKNPTNLCPIIMEVASGMRGLIQVYGNDYNTPDGTCIRDYIHVNDLSKAHLLAMDYIREKNEDLVVNLGTGKGRSVLEMIDAAGHALGKNITFEIVGRRPGDPEELYAATDLASEKLNWTAEHSDLETIFSSMKNVYMSGD
jgi:UDP-glucose 4-epimerase